MSKKFAGARPRMRPPWDEASPLSLALIASRGQCVAIAPGPPTKPCDGERKKLNCGLRIMVSQSLPSALPRHFNPSWLTARAGLQFWVVLHGKVLAAFALGFVPSFAVAADMPNLVYRPPQVGRSWSGPQAEARSPHTAANPKIPA